MYNTLVQMYVYLLILLAYIIAKYKVMDHLKLNHGKLRT